MFCTLLLPVVLTSGPFPSITDATDAPAKLAKLRLEAARQAYEAAWSAFQPFELSKDPEKVYLWSRRWMESALATATTKAERDEALRGHVERMSKLEGQVTMYVALRNTVPFQQWAAAQFYHAEAKIWKTEGKPK
jgi:hypothetical protein